MNHKKTQQAPQRTYPNSTSSIAASVPTDDAIAIIAQREGDDNLVTLTYHELACLTNRIANGLVALGLKPGDAVAVDMPMHAASVAIYLGIVKAGCVVVGIADSFAPDEIATPPPHR